MEYSIFVFFFFSSRRRHTRYWRDWSSDVCSSDLYLIRSTHRLPGRIYPYYLLVKLYAEPEYRQPDKLKRVAEIVLIKEPKVQSTAVKEMKEEVKKIIVNEESIPNQ